MERDRKSSTPKKSPEPKDVAAKDIDEDELDKELQETEKSILEISSQLEELEKQRRIKQKMSKLGKLKKSLEKKKNRIKEVEEEGETKKESSALLNAADLRKNKKIKKNAHKTMAELGLNGESESSDSSSDSDSSISGHSDSVKDSSHSSLGLVASSTKHKKGHKKHHYSFPLTSESDSSSSSRSSRRSKKKKKKSKKSGMAKKSSDKVKYPQIWPHSVLQYEFVSEHVAFKQLSLKMFLCGEMEILTSKISKSEFKGRMRFLKKIVYYSNIYEWSVLLQYYAAWVRRIEMGLNCWSDDPAQIENAMLASKLAKKQSQKDYVPKHEQVWWCSDFNNGKCSFQTSSHQKTVKGHARNVRHICGTCWRKVKTQLKHPETSAACPHKA